MRRRAEPLYDRDHFVFPLSADPAAWARKYDIEPFTAPCYGCGAPLTTSIPFAQGQRRGLLAPTCTCGTDALPPLCMVTLDDAFDAFFGPR